MIEITIPGDVYRALSPNGRCHYMELHRRKQEWKARTRLAWRAAGQPRIEGKARLQITLRRGRSVDPDNATAACIQVVNGLKSEPGMPGLIVDDSPKWLELLPVQQEADRRYKGREEVVVRVESVEDGG